MIKAISAFGLSNMNDLKRDILFFDKIYFDETLAQDQLQKARLAHMYGNAQIANPLSKDELIATTEYLIDLGVLEKIEIVKSIQDGINELYEKNHDEYFDIEKDYKLFREVLYHFFTSYEDNPHERPPISYECKALNFISNLLVRMYSQINSILNDDGFYNINSSEIKFNERESKLWYEKLNESFKFSQTVNVIIENIPVPGDNVPFDEILDWKNQSDNLLRYKRLHNWINKSVNGKLSAAELKDEIEYLTLEFEHRMKLEKMNYRLTNMNSLIYIPFKVIEDTIKLNWSNIPKTLFSIKQSKTKLLIAETKAVGKEISYLSSMKNKFENKKARN